MASASGMELRRDGDMGGGWNLAMKGAMYVENQDFRNHEYSEREIEGK